MGRLDSPLRDRMVFLVGVQRSGTNWLQSMLAAHPDVAALPGETQLFALGVDSLRRNVHHGVLRSTSTASLYMEPDAFLDATRAFCDAALGGAADVLSPGARRILERSPNHVEHLDLIAEVYPDAWVVHLLRDGRDVARSLVSQPWGPDTVAAAAELWVGSVRAARTAAAGLARYREVRYENLLQHPGGEVAELFRFLDIDASDAMVAAAVQAGLEGRNLDARDPRVGSGKWRDEWTPDDVATFEAVAATLLTELGYPSVPGSRSVRRGLPRARAPRRWFPARSVASPGRPHIPLEARQRRVDAVCAALAGTEVRTAVRHLAPDATVAVIGHGQEEKAVGAAAAELLERLAASAPAGRQKYGDVHVGGALFAVVQSRHVHDGASADQVVVLRFGADDMITAVTVYRFPL